MDKREHIIEVAIDLFSEKGYEGTSIRDLAAQADVNIAMINYYFGSKEKLFESILQSKAYYIKEKLDEIILNKSLSDIEKMDAVIESYVNRLLTQHKFQTIIHQELMLQQRSALYEEILIVFLKNKEAIKSIIESGINKKSFKKVDAELTIASIIGTINQVLLSNRMCKTLVTSEEHFDPYTDEKFRKRLITHLQQIIHSHLLNK
jgi:AcrR family transcriptional regulator